ncbi:MAG: hypothetical protein JNM84_01200 [Planctomycetes bacterium]|nr:hypothetical protein [Planctomycetota bacterium]
MSRRQSEDPRDIEAIRVLRTALPTKRRARLLFDTLAARFEKESVLVLANGGLDRCLFRRDAALPEALVPWPWIHYSERDAVPETSSDEEEPFFRPSPYPTGLEISDGASTVELRYDVKGLLQETTRGGPASYWMHLARAVREAQGNAFEDLVDAVASSSTARGGSGRLLYPQPSPHSIERAFELGLDAVRNACFERELDAGALWIAADGFAGSAIVAHPECEVALALCREAIAREEPRPKPSKSSPMLTPEELAELGWEGEVVSIQGPAHAEAEPILPCVANTPIFLTTLDALPQRASPLGTWERLLDARGTCRIVAARRDRRGTLIATPQALARLDPSRIDAALERADQREIAHGHFAMPMPWPASLPPLRSQIWIYEIERARSGDAEARICAASRTPEFRYAQITPESVGEGILRQEWVR